ncbi:hypothetical protein BKA66DRAFT_405516 [Pyrenochaeta sp. MPI-SDFR-AT-0127]|nr:hypothetical protein BKA66DRAFT_405516 [Pyrenochaeta sp. MPI-SDFR-AT-0127]
MKSRQYFDPVGETEPHTTLYTLAVYTPPRPPSRWLPNIFTRIPVTYPNTGPTFILPPSDDPNKPKYDGLILQDLRDMSSKFSTIQSAWFPVDMRCEHVRCERKFCEEGCYLLEKGGNEATRHRCSRSDCEGHAYSGRVKMDDEGKECFGKKGQRMVCLIRS